jgi:hypothetical protein
MQKIMGTQGSEETMRLSYVEKMVRTTKMIDI